VKRFLRVYFVNESVYTGELLDGAISDRALAAVLVYSCCCMYCCLLITAFLCRDGRVLTNFSE
jgi:hypothetical protein